MYNQEQPPLKDMPMYEMCRPRHTRIVSPLKDATAERNDTLLHHISNAQ